MPLIKNIFTKNVHFYTTVVSYTSLQDPEFWFKPAPIRLSVFDFTIVKQNKILLLGSLYLKLT